MIPDQGFDGDELEGRMVVVEQEGVPEAADPSIPVLERVKKIQFIVKTQERMRGLSFSFLRKRKRSSIRWGTRSAFGAMWETFEPL